MRTWTLDRPMDAVCASRNTKACYCTFISQLICWHYCYWSIWLVMPSAKNMPLCYRGGIKSPWSRRKRKRALSREQWESLFSANGKLRDGGRKFLKKVRSGVSAVFIHFPSKSSRYRLHQRFIVGYLLHVVKYTVMLLSLLLLKCFVS